MKRDIFLIALWLIFGLAGVYFVGMMLYIASGLNVVSGIVPYNTWNHNEAFFSGIGGMLCICASTICRMWYFDTAEDD